MLGHEPITRAYFVEMSTTNMKFYIVALELETNAFHVIELWRAQANKLLKACGNSYEKLTTYLEFKFGTMKIRDYDMLIIYTS